MLSVKYASRARRGLPPSPDGSVPATADGHELSIFSR